MRAGLENDRQYIKMSVYCLLDLVWYIFFALSFVHKKQAFLPVSVHPSLP